MVLYNSTFVGLSKQQRRERTERTAAKTSGRLDKSCEPSYHCKCTCEIVADVQQQNELPLQSAFAGSASSKNFLIKAAHKEVGCIGDEQQRGMLAFVCCASSKAVGISLSHMCAVYNTSIALDPTGSPSIE